DFRVTGVQTCALPICPPPRLSPGRRAPHILACDRGILCNGPSSVRNQLPPVRPRAPAARIVPRRDAARGESPPEPTEQAAGRNSDRKSVVEGEARKHE